MIPLLAVAVFLGAALVFLIQPMVAKMLLPLLGGTPGVWNTCMVFFQATLLAGYAYAHAITRLRPAHQLTLHAAVLAAPIIVLPIALPPDAAPPTESGWTLWLLTMLALTAGLPAFAAAATAPLVQRWFSTTPHPSARDPYFLYAASNAGSLLALLAYPVLIEPALTLREQGWLWSSLYTAFLLTMLVGAITMRSAGGLRARPTAAAAETTADPATPLSTRERLLWLFLAAVPSSLLIGVTTLIATDIASVPLLWIVPLAVYLLTFINAFASRPLIPTRLAIWAIPILALAAALLTNNRIPAWSLMALHLAVLAAAGLACHGGLAARRPHPARLTEFYLLIALGGALGGAFNSFLAPIIFVSIVEYPLVVALACIIAALAAPQSDRLRTPRLAFAVAGAAAFAIVWEVRRSPLEEGATALHTTRTFFGVHRVISDPPFRQLRHGTTLHGAQFDSYPDSLVPQSYFHPTSPIGRVFFGMDTVRPPQAVAVVGLGAGALAAYGREGQRFDFYEIDPAVVEIASDPELFTYLRDCVALGNIITGDARLNLAKQPESTYDLIILDAFSSDAVPTHLLTREALREYLRTLRPGGLIAANITNRYFDLAPMLDALARAEGLTVIFAMDGDIPNHPLAGGKLPSGWAVMGRSMSDLAPLLRDPIWVQLKEPSKLRPWTDDYSNILSVLRWRGN